MHLCENSDQDEKYKSFSADMFIGNVSVNGCLSLYVSPVMNWPLGQGEPRPRQVQLGLTSTPCNPAKDTRLQKVNE